MHGRDHGPRPRGRTDSSDLYEVLQVSPHASPDVIQAAYRTLARHSHPDVSGSVDAGQRIRQLNAAYGVLSDAELRARYDLERVRARRRDIRAAGRTSAQAPLAEPGFARVTPARTAPARRAPEKRMSTRNPQFIALATMGVALTTLLLFLVWSSIDSLVGDESGYATPAIHLFVP